VADGEAWAGRPEIDPALDYEKREEIEGREMTPLECMNLAYGGVMRERFIEAGSSTACLINLNTSSGMLRSANLGDSGFSIIRSSSIIYTQPIQTHYFNCPKQLTKMPENVRKFRSVVTDYPNDADTYQTRLRDGDLVIAYTDGLSDNVFPDEIIDICSLVARSGGPEDEQVQTMADDIVAYAWQCMGNVYRLSPFERDAAREGMFFKGGKVDDVTVIVTMVRKA